MSHSATNGAYHIIAVADGHGAASCFRSSIGSEFATKVAFDCLKQFAESILSSEDSEYNFYKSIFSDPRYRRTVLKQLTDMIIARWYDFVIKDYHDNVPSSNDMELVPEKYRNEGNIPHIYGTTLIAILMLPSCLVMLHQGDGRCDIFYEDGNIEQPIPWDIRCEGNVTTSLCDSDVAESFRSCVINLTTKKIAACYLCSDGVEDAYRDTYEDIGGTHCIMGGVHTFFKDLSCQLVSNSTSEFEEYLAKILPEFSANGLFSRSGSGDDVSVAGIVDIEALRPLVSKFALDVKEYSLEEELSLKEDERSSKTRKHEFLKERRDKAQTEYEKIAKPFIDFSTQMEQLQSEHLELINQIKSLQENIDKLKMIEQEIMDYTSKKIMTLSTTTQEFLKVLKKCSEETGFPIRNIPEKISSEIKKHETECLRQRVKLASIEDEIQRVSRQISSAPASLKILEKNFKDAEAEFAEYDSKYQAISDEKNRIQSELDKLHSERKTK